MVVVDTSVWIGHLGQTGSEAVLRLDAVMISRPYDILVGDAILLELLQGASDDRHASRIERNLRAFSIQPMLGVEVAVEAAKNYRALRGKGVTVRSMVDMIIGSYCLLHDHMLLHDDRDFDPMVRYLGLRVLAD